MKCDVCSETTRFAKHFWKSQYWQCSLAYNQYYLGYGALILKRHTPDISSLTKEEWTELFSLMKKIERATTDILSATHVNWHCWMNEAFTERPFNPHVHWHFRPRYEKQVEFAGETFIDQEFGKRFDSFKKKEVSEKAMREIENVYKGELK